MKYLKQFESEIINRLRTEYINLNGYKLKWFCYPGLSFPWIVCLILIIIGPINIFQIKIQGDSERQYGQILHNHH